MNFHSVNKTHASLSLHHTNDNHQLPNPHNLFRGSRWAENWCPASSYVRHSSAWASPAASLSKFRLTCCANRQLHGYVCFHRQITKYKDIVTIWNKQSWLRLCHVDSWVHRSSPSIHWPFGFNSRHLRKVAVHLSTFQVAIKTILPIKIAFTPTLADMVVCHWNDLVLP